MLQGTEGDCSHKLSPSTRKTTNLLSSTWFAFSPFHKSRGAVPMGGCGANGELEAGDYTKPLPWIGVYVAAGSLYCAAAMALDAYSGFRRRKFWFPTKLFSLNATTLTILAVATKFPVDLNTSMPRAADQLTKLSGTVLICTVTANFMPSLGDMGDSEILSNVVAMGILVITVVVNVGIQMGTGVIFSFLPEHAIVMLLMMVLLVLMVSSALTVSTTKQQLDQQYISKHREAVAAKANVVDAGADGAQPLEELKVHVKRHWLMAHTSSPQYVLGRSATCTASGAFCLLAALVLSQALLRALLGGPAVRFCNGESDYGWSTTLVLSAQVAAVLIGTVAPAYRWFYAVNFRSTDQEGWSCSDEFTVEDYWVERLEDWKEAPLPIHISRSSLKRVAHDLNSHVMAVVIMVQKGVVLASKFVRLLSVVPVSWLRQGGRMLRRSGSSMRGGPRPDAEGQLKNYVLHLEGEEDLVKLITKSERKDTEMWMEKGQSKPPRALVQLIRDYSTASQGFIEVRAFDSSGTGPLGPEEPPNCWALPLVTLAAVAAALPGVERGQVNLLLRGVRQGLRFVKLVETNLDEMGLVSMREAAELVWLRVELYGRWLDWDLRVDSDGRKIVEAASRIAKQEVIEFTQKLRPQNDVNAHVLSWPEKVLAANCMYRVCASILHGYDLGKHRTNADLFAWLRTAIADVLGACFTNLSRALYLECFSHRVEGREKGVRDAALSIGEAEDILEIVQSPQVTAHFPASTQYIDEWEDRGQGSA